MIEPEGHPIFARLKKFAMDELAQARSEIAGVAEPVITTFGINQRHFQRDGDDWDSLKRDVAKTIPNDSITIYYIEPHEWNLEAAKLIRALFVATKSQKDGRSRDNQRDSGYLYVGSSRKMPTRLREHLGFCSPTTYALKLCDWYPGEDLPLRLTCAVYPAETSATIIGALEDALWERLKPMFGRKGAR